MGIQNTEDSFVKWTISKLMLEPIPLWMSSLLKDEMVPHSDKTVIVVDNLSAIRRITQSIRDDLHLKGLQKIQGGAASIRMLETSLLQIKLSDWNVSRMTELEVINMIRSLDHSEDYRLLMMTADELNDKIVTVVKVEVNKYIFNTFS